MSGLAIGASTSGFVADIVMERLEKKALSSYTHPPSFWCRFVDDIYSIIKKIQAELFERHLNTQHERVKFTRETEKDKKLPYLDALTQRREDGTLKATIYRKPTHTDRYLDFTSNHHISQKLAVPKTLLRRADMLVSEEEDKKVEETYVKKALSRCGYPQWAVERKKEKNPVVPKIDDKKKKEEESLGRVLIPYIKHVSEAVAREFRKFNAEVIYMPTTKLKNVVCANMKDTVPNEDKAEVVYLINCKKHDESYIGHTKKPNKERGYEHNVISHAAAHSSKAIYTEDDRTVSTRTRTKK